MSFFLAFGDNLCWSGLNSVEENCDLMQRDGWQLANTQSIGTQSGFEGKLMAKDVQWLWNGKTEWNDKKGVGDMLRHFVSLPFNGRIVKDVAKLILSTKICEFKSRYLATWFFRCLRQFAFVSCCNCCSCLWVEHMGQLVNHPRTKRYMHGSRAI